jgi:hypothetical protein
LEAEGWAEIRGEVAQIVYTYVSKYKNNKIKFKNKAKYLK